MPKILIANIDWGERAREKYTGLQELAESIRTKGLLHPIVISDGNKLRAGGRRLSAVVLLGWTEVECTELRNLSPLEAKEVELEENIMRESLTWTEEVSLMEEIHKIKQALNPSKIWTTSDTADVVNECIDTVQRKLRLAKSIAIYPELKEAKDINSAFTIERRLIAASRRALASRDQKDYTFLHHGDALEILSTIPENTVDLMLLDPPYGTNIHRGIRTPRGDWSGRWGGVFDDSTKEAFDLMDGILAEAHRVLKEGGHCYLFFAIASEIQEGIISRIISKHLNYQKAPLIWIKNTHSNKEPYHRYAVNYESIYFCWKGPKQRELSNPHFATFNISVNTKLKEHPTEKPAELYRELIKLSTSRGDVVLDPTMGSGQAIATAILMERQAIGIEVDERWFNLAKERVRKTLLNPTEEALGDEGSSDSA